MKSTFKDFRILVCPGKLRNKYLKFWKNLYAKCMSLTVHQWIKSEVKCSRKDWNKRRDQQIYCYGLHVLRRKSAAQVFVFVNFRNFHVCFALCHTRALQFFLYLPILGLFVSVLCSAMFSFLHFSILVMFMCFVFRHVQRFVFFNFINVLQMSYFKTWGTQLVYLLVYPHIVVFRRVSKTF